MDPESRERERERRRRRERRESRGPPTDNEAAYDTERRRRRGHRATDSQGDLLPKSTPRQSRHQSDSEWDSPSPRKQRHSHRESPASASRSRGTSSAAPLSLDALGKLDKANAKKAGWRGYDYDEQYLKEVRKKEEKLEKERVKVEREERRKERERLKLAEDEEAIERKARERREQEESRRREKKKAAAIAANEEVRRRSRTRHEGEKRSLTDTERDERRRRYEERYTPEELAEKRERRRKEKAAMLEQKKRRVVSGPLAEEGGVEEEDEYHYMMEKRGGAGTAPSQYTEEELAKRKKKKKWMIIAAISVALLLAIIIPVGVVTSKKKDAPATTTSSSSGSSAPSNSNLDGKDRNSVPEADRGGILDPWAWYDTTDFNVTYTSATVGGLPIIGLNSTWDDNVQANSAVPNLQDAFEYGKKPVRGVNVGGWLNMEPFITPSYFEQYSVRDNVIDEWTLCAKLGPSKCKDTLEKHYATFITKSSFAAIRNAGFDHVRIPFGYWMVQTYDDDVYVPQVSWRYLLRGIEYARQNGLRVNLDFHGVPGSQNGWNHSGRQGVIGWLNGTNGDTNAQRWLDIHHKLSVFFAQPRYRNVVTMYGLVNEPRMVALDKDKVIKWTQKAYDQIRGDNITAIIVFGDGFMGLDNWQGKLQGNKNLLLDVHQYVIFNIDQLSLTHTDKLNFACNAWTQQSKRSMDTTTGFGPTMCGEWSQADTDCTQYINNVNVGTRWEGTYNSPDPNASILSPQCPAKTSSCSCAKANEDPANYSDAYKRFLYRFAVAQITAFEAGWGWFYWTWETEKATQWSWRRGIEAGILPEKVGSYTWSCPSKVEDFEDFGKEGLSELY